MFATSRFHNPSVLFLDHDPYRYSSVQQAELTGLKKQLGLSAGDANHTPFQKTAGGSGLRLPEYFEWAEVGHEGERCGIDTSMCLI